MFFNKSRMCDKYEIADFLWPVILLLGTLIITLSNYVIDHCIEFSKNFENLKHKKHQNLEKKEAKKSSEKNRETLFTFKYQVDSSFWRIFFLTFL